MARPGTIQKGEVRNPNGARKKNTAVSDLAAKEAPNAFAGIVALAMTCPDLRIRLDALKYIVDRSMGRPGQAVELSGENGGPVIAIIRDKDAAELFNKKD